MKKRLLSLFLALIMVLGMIPVTGAEEITVVDSGSCGADMTWTLTSDGLLTISGTGEMEYEDGGWIGPWYYDHSDEIHSVVVEEGVVSVGSAAFMSLDNLVSVSLPATLEDFDTGDTFNQTPNLETITVAEGNQNFCSVDGVLYSKDMRYLWKVPAAMTGDFAVPESVTWLYAFVFESCTNLDSVTFKGNAPDIFYVAFQDAVVDCFYPEDNPTWTKNLLQNYGGTLTWNGEPAVDMQLYMQRMAYADPEGTTWAPFEEPFPVESFHMGGDNPHRFLCGTSLDDLVPVNEVYVSSGSKYLTLTAETYEYEGETGTLYWIEGEGDVGKKGRLTYYVDELPYEQTFYLTIPIVGCFSDGFYAEYNWLGGWTLSYDSAEDYTFWILREQGFPAESEFVDCDDTGIVVESVEIGNDLYGCRVTVPAGTLVGDRWINVQIVHDGQPMSGGWSVRMRDTAPKGELFHCTNANDGGGDYANLDGGYFPAEISLDSEDWLYFFYELDGEMLPVVSVEPVEADTVRVSTRYTDPNGYIRWDISGVKLGTQELKIKVAGSDTVYLAEVECVLPDVGFYLADEISAKAHWRFGRIPYSVGQQNKVWLLFKDGLTGEESVSFDPALGLTWQFVDVEVGKGVEITIPDTLTTRETITVDIRGTNMMAVFSATLDPQDGSFGWAEPNWSEEGWSEPAASISGAPVLQAGTEIPSYLYLMKDGEKLRFDAVWSMDEDLVVDEETDVNGETLYMLSCDKVGTYWLGMRAADSGILYYMQLECVLPGIGCYSSPAANAEDLYLGENVPFNAGTEKTFWIVSDLGFTGEETISLPSSSYRGSELEFEFVDRTDSNTWKALQVTVKDTVETSGHIKLELTGGSDTVMGHMITINMVESTPRLYRHNARNDGSGWYEIEDTPLWPMVQSADWNIRSYLYYGADGEQERVTDIKVVNPDDVIIWTYIDRENETFWGLNAQRIGEIELLVRVEGDKNWYPCTMTARVPDVGLYSQPQEREEYYYWNQTVPFVAGTETVFWMSLAEADGTETLTSSNPLVTIEHMDGESGRQMAKVTVGEEIKDSCSLVLKAEKDAYAVQYTVNLIESSPRIWRVIGEVQNDTWQPIAEYGVSSMLYTPSSDGYFLYYGGDSNTAKRITHMELVDPDQAMIYTHADSDGLPVYQVFTESAAPIPVRLQVQGDDTVYESALQFDLPEISYFRAPLFNGSNFYTGPVEYEAGVGSEFWILTQTGLKGTEPVTMDDRLTWEWVDTEQEGVKAIHVIIPATLSGTQFCEATVKHEGGTTHMSFALVDDTPQIQWQHVGNLGDELYFRSGRDMAEVMQVENGTDISYALYYGPYYDPQPIVDVQLPATAKIKVEKLNTTLPAFHIQTAGCETITATVTTADGNTYSVPLQVTLPFIGLYREAERTEANLIADWTFDYTPGGDDAVYILGENGLGEKVQLLGNFPTGASWEKQLLTDGTYAVKITADTLTGDLTRTYRVVGLDYNWGIDLTFNDLTTDAAYSVYQLREYVNGTYGDPVTELTHGYATSKTYGLFRGDTRITDFTWSVAEGDKNAVTLVKDKATGNFDLTMNTYDPFVLEFEADDVAGEIPHVADNLLSQTFTIDGEDYVLALCQDRRGRIEDMSPYMGFGAYGFSEEDPDEVADERTFIVAMLQDYRMGEDPVFAPADIQSKIESVTFGVEDDDNGVFVVAQQPQKTADGWYQGELHLKQIAGDGYFTATVKLRDEEEPIKLRFYGHIGMTQETVIDCEDEGIDTVAKLNKLIANLEIGSNERVIINLIPGHTYTGTIYASTEGDWDLVGQVDEDGRCTTIVGGIVMEEQMGFIDSICFIAPETTETTTAISHDGGYAYTVSNSVFYGYDVAVDCTEDGYTLPEHNNLFVNNGVAVRLDCAKMNGGNANEGMCNNTFIGNGTALDIRGLPSYLNAEDFEVWVSDFLNNDLDISVPDGEVWFCHRNYFGVSGTTDSQQCAAKTSGQVYTEIGLSRATVARFHGYRPWWAETLRRGGVLDDLNQLPSGQVAADDTMQKVLNFLSGVKIKMAVEYPTSVAPGAQSTVVRNSDAKTLWLSEAALKELQQELAMQVLDDDGNPVGTWIFSASNDPNGNTQNSLDHTLTVEERQDGSLEITVQDSTALQNCQPSLQIQVGDAWQMAAVTDPAGNSVAVQWDDAKQTVTFPVAEGGTYTVTEVVTQTAVITVEDAEALSGDTITLPVTIAENPGFAAFNLELVYNSALELLSVEVGNLLQGEDLVINGNYVLWYGMNNVTGDGDLLELTFKVPDDCAAGDYTVAVKLTDDQPKNLTNVASKAVPVEFRDATIHVEEFLLGDVNEDRGVFTDDAVLLAQALVKAVTLSQRQTKAADVDFDGDLTAADLVKLVQYLLGNIQDLRENLAPMLAATAPKLMMSMQMYAGTTFRPSLTAGTGTPEVSVDQVQGLCGETVLVPVRIKNNAGLSGFTLDVDYDTDAMEFIGVEAGEIVTSANKMYCNAGRVVMVNSSAYHGDGILFYLVFRVAADAEKTLQPVRVSLPKNDVRDFVHASKNMPVFRSGGVTPTLAIPTEAAMETASNGALTLTYDLELAKSVDVNQVHVSVSLYDGGRMAYFGTLEVPENATTITVPYAGAFDSGKLYVLDQQYAPMASALRLEVAP